MSRLFHCGCRHQRPRTRKSHIALNLNVFTLFVIKYNHEAICLSYGNKVTNFVTNLRICNFHFNWFNVSNFTCQRKYVIKHFDFCV